MAWSLQGELSVQLSIPGAHIGALRASSEGSIAPEADAPAAWRRAAPFNVRVSFSDDGAGIRFRPDEFRVTEALVTNAVQGAVALLSSLPRVSHTRSFVPFYEGTPSGTRLL